MKTKPLYLNDSYLKEMDAEVTEVGKIKIESIEKEEGLAIVRYSIAS